jgi:hypothetical protein
VLGSDHKIATRYRKKETESTQYRLQIGGIDFCESVMSHGVTSAKARTMIFPNVPNKYFGDFVRGYFDGDGNIWTGLMHKKRTTVTKSALVSFTSGSYYFLFTLLHNLHKRGVKGGSLVSIKSKECFRLTFSTSDSLKIFKIMYNTDTNLFLSRKKKLFDTFMRP